MKDTICKHCGATNSHFSFQCATQRKPIAKKVNLNKPVQSTKTIKPIPKQSDKEKKRQAAYSVLKKEFMKSHKYCEAKLPGCVSIAIDVHHPYFGADRYKYFLDDSTYIAICRSCHHVVHDELSSEELIELGLRKKE